MLHFLDPFRDFTLASVALRMLLTVLCGGLIGIERAFKRRSAGFRTHILICLGAAMTTMTIMITSMIMNTSMNMTSTIMKMKKEEQLPMPG